MRGSTSTWLCLAWLIVCLAGCQGNADAERGLTSADVEDALHSDEVHTIRDFYRRLRDLPVKNAQTFFGDFEARERDGIEFEDYVARDIGDHNPGVTRIIALDRIAERMTWWRYPTRQVTETDKVYLLRATHPTKLQDLANWGVGVTFRIFVDDRGKILGWTNSQEAKGR